MPPRCPVLCGQAAAVPRRIQFSSAGLRNLQLLRQCGTLVVAVQRIATRRQTLPRRGRAIAECSANSLVLDFISLRRIPQYLGIGQHHPSEPNQTRPPLPTPAFAYYRRKPRKYLEPGPKKDHFGK